MTASSREVKIANREAIWCQVKKKEFLDDPTFMKTHKLLEHPVVTHTKFDKRILLLQCWRHKLGYLVSKFWRSVQYLQALLNTLCTKTDNRHGTLKKKKAKEKEVQSIFIKAKACEARQTSYRMLPWLFSSFAFTALGTHGVTRFMKYVQERKTGGHRGGLSKAKHAC